MGLATPIATINWPSRTYSNDNACIPTKERTMTPTRAHAITSYLGSLPWTSYPANGCLGVTCGRLSYYFFFNDADEIVRVIID